MGGVRCKKHMPKSLSPEAHVTINSIPITSAQVMAVRVAVSGMITDLHDKPDSLGTDQHGRFMHEAYLARLREVEALLLSR